MRRPPLRPVAWRPPPAPPRARRSRSDRPLPPVRTIEVGYGPEDVLVEPDAAVFTGFEDGRLLRVRPDAGPDLVATVEGRPLGLEFLPGGRLLVCVAGLGLLAVDVDTGGVEVLADTVAGEPLLVCN